MYNMTGTEMKIDKDEEKEKGCRVMDIEKEIRILVTEYTKEFCRTQKIEYDTLSISKTLNISRTLASQYLNRMVKSGEFLKIISRPVYYLRKKTIEDYFRMELNTDTFYSLEELTELFDKKLLEQRGFVEAVGYDTTLRYLIAQCQAAVKYPPSGVPVLLCGEPGVGKTYFAQLIYEYARSESVLPASAKCLWLNYSRVNENKFDDDKLLFGSWSISGNKDLRRKEGLLEEAKDGFVIIENVEKMSARCLEKVIGYIRTGTWTIRGDSTLHHSSTRLIFTTCESLRINMENTLLQVIPVVCKLPTLEARPVRDKEELISRCLKEEGKRIGRKVKLSRQCFEILLNASFAYNISGLLGCMKTLCTNAFLSRQENETELCLYTYDLPEELLNSARKTFSYEDTQSEMLDMEVYKASEPGNLELRFFDSLVRTYRQYKEIYKTREQFIQKCVENMNLYYDYIVFEKKYVNGRLQSIEKLIDGIFGSICDAYDIYIPQTCVYVVARIIYSSIEINSELGEWERENHEDLTAMLNCFAGDFPAETDLANEIMDKIHAALEVSPGIIHRVFLILNLQFYNRKIAAANCEGLILEHGYSTASSIVDVVNKLLGKHVFDAVDMPLDMTLKDLAPMLKRYIKGRNVSRDLLLMVDMGSLEHAAEIFEELSNVRIGVIDNVSTKVALSIGEKLMEGMDLEEMLTTVCREETCRFRIIDRSSRKNAVFFVTESGSGLAERMIQLFRSSLTDKMELLLLPYDYRHLLRNLNENELFSKYNVLFVVSTEKLELKQIPVIPLENMIAAEDSKVIKIISQYFPKEEVEAFKKNLLKNFSFENVVRHLTILDADKLLDFVADALEMLQKLMNVRLNDSTTVGLYIHISNMIERIVTNSYFMNQEEAAEVSEEEKKFTRIFHTAFDSLCRHYNIKIPQSEICYICSYMELGIKK